MMLVCPLILSGQLLLFIDLMADVEPFLLCLDRCSDKISGRSYCQIVEGRRYSPMFEVECPNLLVYFGSTTSATLLNMISTFN